MEKKKWQNKNGAHKRGRSGLYDPEFNSDSKYQKFNSHQRSYSQGGRRANLDSIVRNDYESPKQNFLNSNTERGQSENHGQRSNSQPFRRVKAESYHDSALNQLDNRFSSLPNARDNWGAKANQKLQMVQGKNFKSEKTKKKRGEYSGGTRISLQVNSIKF